MSLPRPTASAAALNLQHSLLLRLCLTGLAITLLLWCGLVWRGHAQALAQLPATAAVVQQLLNHDQLRLGEAFSREHIPVDLTVLEPLGRRLAFCVMIDDQWGRRSAHACLRPHPPLALADTVSHLFLAPRTAVPAMSLPLLRPPGLSVGTIHVTPDWASLISAWTHTLAALLLGWGVLIGVARLLIRPVQRALQPADRILEAIGQLAEGRTDVTLPAFELREFQRIGAEVNKLAVELSATRTRERERATQLLDAREAERRHLARELHDDMGQRLTSLRAELAFLRHELQPHSPQPTPAPQPATFAALENGLAQLHDTVQDLVHRLRPPGLDAFGLAECLRQLVRDCPRRPDGKAVEMSLAITGDLTRLPGECAIHTYRIVQEGLTNALRHAQATYITIKLHADETAVRVELSDNGTGYNPLPAHKRGGHGLTGIAERVGALGGHMALNPVQPSGTRLCAHWPLPTAQANA